MLQRSPSYYLPLPEFHHIGTVICRILPQYVAHNLMRMINALFSILVFRVSMRYPEAAKKFFISLAAKRLPPNIPVDPHFTPKYYPWEQRLCVCPDGDFFAALRNGNASVVTDHIATFTKDSVCLQSGTTLAADVVITATGLKMVPAGGIQLDVDGKPVNASEKFFWKGVMLDDVPNATFCLGYIYTSWMLGADASMLHICRLLNDMKKSGADTVVPRCRDKQHMPMRPAFDLKSTYAKAGELVLPKTSTMRPWAARMNWFYDSYDAVLAGYGENLLFSSSKDKKKTWKMHYNSRLWRHFIVLVIAFALLCILL